MKTIVSISGKISETHFDNYVKQKGDVGLDIKINNCKNDNTIFNKKNWVEYTDEVKKALEKQMPTKPLNQIDKNNELLGSCPACKLMWSVGYWERYCSNCGQKLDWS